VKILIVSHRYPPHGRAGTETYAGELAAGLARRGHEVHVFAAVKDIGRRHLSLGSREEHGVRIHEIVNNLHDGDFRATWDIPELDAIFADVCARVAPDVVHFQHLMYLSAGCVEIARRHAAVLFTLHDFWLQCPRFGQRVHADGGVCHTIDFARCGTCLVSFKYAQTATERNIGRIVARVRAGTGVNLAPLARKTASVLRARSSSLAPGGSARAPGDRRTADDAAHAFARAAEERSRALQRRVIAGVDRFLAPSRFLRERFVSEWGVPEAQIEHLRFGVDLRAFAPIARERSDTAHVAFIGSRIPVKGPHVLLEAWSKLDPALRSRADLTIYGPDEHEPPYQKRLAELARVAGARLAGRLERNEVPRVLARTSLLVVPSLWYENAPLVIHEALASRTPLLVSDMGGMAELVEPGVSGYRFRMGDVDDLARKLAELLGDRARLDRLYASPVELPRVEEHCEEIERRYRELAQARAQRRAP
jgi:glycosyltransferase involved in cell wall biosynthesis